MKPIKIDIHHCEAIHSALQEANGRSKSHTFQNYSDINFCAMEAERRLTELGIPKKNRPGAVYIELSGERLPNAYKYRINVTRAVLQRFPEGWRLVSVCLQEVWEGGGTRLHLTEPQAELAMSATRAKFAPMTPL